MEYEFYADVFILTNMYLDFLAVFMVGEILQQKRRIFRYIIGCSISSLLGCLLFLVLSSYEVYLVCIHFMVNPAMVVFCFFPAEKRTYGKAFGLMYLVIFLLGGCVEWSYHTITGARFYEVCLLLTGIPVAAFLYILRKKRKKVQSFYPVLIEHKERKITLQALYDTGNSLMDPYRKEPVHIISKAFYEALGGSEEFLVRLIPFSSVGCERGMLEAFTVESVTVNLANEKIVFSPAVLAAAEKSIFQNRTYQMILNSSVGERIERKES